MDRTTAQELMEIYLRVGNALNEADPIIRAIPNEAERSQQLHALGMLMGNVWIELQAPIVRQHPELDPDSEVGTADPCLTVEEQKLVAGLAPLEVQRIDDELIANCTSHWRKVARVVGKAMAEVGDRIEGIPDLYYAQRVAALVQDGRLEAQGNLRHMRCSEVRLPAK